MKIAVYAIAKNEAEFVERFMASANSADLVLVADTGSDDDTIKRVLDWDFARGGGFPKPEAGGAEVHITSLSISPWRFDHARNAALALLPADVDVCVSLDLDEELQPGWREEIERHWTPETTQMRYRFDWGSGIVFYAEKIHARRGYWWSFPCHERITPDPRMPVVWAQSDELLVVHKPDDTKSRGGYLDLLELSVAENPTEPHNAFYLAREYYYRSRFEDARAGCERYLAMPGATWADERCYAMRVASECSLHLGDWPGAFRWARKAVAEAPDTREPWCLLALLAYRQARWGECFGAAMSALAITERRLVYTADPKAWGAEPHDLASIAAWNLGLNDKAKEQAALALAKDPQNPRLRENLAFLVGEPA